MKIVLGILIIVCIFAIVSLLLLSFSTSMIKNIEEEDNENINLNICDYCDDKNHCDKCIYREEEDKNN